VTILARLKVRIKRAIFAPAGRDRWQRPDEIVSALDLRRGQRVVDLGSGTGYYTFRLARAVGSDGVVYATDTDPDLLEDLADRAQKAGIANIRPTTAPKNGPGIPEAVDLLFLSHVYHHLPDHIDYFGRVRRSLLDGGRVAIVERRPGGLMTRRFGHSTDPAIIRREMGGRLSARRIVQPRRPRELPGLRASDRRGGRCLTDAGWWTKSSRRSSASSRPLPAAAPRRAR
jgi:SAM-dependent methyltransferase